MSTAKKKIVLVDMDGVIANFELGYERAITKMFPSMKLIPREERNVFYNDVQYAHIYPQHEDAFHRIALKPGFFRHLPVMEGAKAGQFPCSSKNRRYFKR